MATNIIKQNMITVTPITLTPSSGVTIASDTRTIAYGKLVTLSIDVSKSSVTSGWNEYFSVPTEYLPRVLMYMLLFNTGEIAGTDGYVLSAIDENGILTIRNPEANVRYYGTVVYVAR